MMRKQIITNIPYFIVFYLIDKCAWLYRYCTGQTAVEKLGVLFMNLELAFSSLLPSFFWQDLLAGLVGALAFKGIIYYRSKNAKKFRQGEEYGSARWSA